MKFDAVAAVALAVVLAGAAPSNAQAPSGTEQTDLAPAPEGVGQTNDTYGSASTSYVIGAYDFEPFSSASTFSGQPGTGDRFFTSAGGFWLAPAYLPNGAVITRIEIQGCDTSAGNLTASLFSNTTTGGTQSETGHGSAATTGTPGCGFFSTTLTATVVNNTARTYYIQVTQGTADTTNRFSAVRLYYNLQVSAAPATATFPNDVPTTHGFFRFIEAMAASGLTGGCGPGAFCPNNPVTRGELAVFLSVALGLHFPN